MNKSILVLGCSYRALLFSHHLTQYLEEKFPGKNFDPPKKHFIFGYLRHITENAGNDIAAEWQYHVALAVKIRNSNTLFILDPSLNPKPVTKANFHQRFKAPASYASFISGFVTCDANTIGKENLCVNPTENQLQFLQSPKIGIFLNR